MASGDATNAGSQLMAMAPAVLFSRNFVGMAEEYHLANLAGGARP